VAAGCSPSPGGGTTPAPEGPPPTGQLAAEYDWTSTTRFLDSAVASGATPGAVLGVSFGGERLVYGTGVMGLDDPTRPDSTTVYDLASLTKVVGLTSAVMLAVARGMIDLDEPVTSYLPAFAADSSKQLVTVRHLLTHTSGLPAWRALYQEAPDRDSALALVNSTPLDTMPGARAVYSDLGAIVLTEVVEAAWGMRLDQILRDQIFGPLGMEHTTFVPPASWRAKIAPTEDDPWRGHVVRGEVHDENAARLGGVSGHAGLFSTVPDLLEFGEWLLAGMCPRDPPAPGGGCGPTTYQPPEQIRMFAVRQDLVPGSSRALGWDTPSGVSSSGTLMSSRSFGHTGFTGTSMWIDPTRRLVIVLLTNRVHPTRENSRIGPVRSGVADRVVLTLVPDAEPRPDAVAR